MSSLSKLLFTGIAVALAVPLTLATAQNADNTDAIAPGARVRFTVSDAQSLDSWDSRRMLLKGTVTDVRRDSLVIRFGGAGALMTVSRSAIGDLSVSRGVQRGWRADPKRVAMGAVLVGMNAMTIASMARLRSRAQSTPGARPPSLAPMIALSAVSTGLVVTRAFSRTERWERVTP